MPGLEVPILLSVLLTALTLGPAMAHLLEAPVKLFLPREQYFQVQQIYRGWTFAGVFVGAALVSTGWLATSVQGRALWFSLGACACLAGALLVFWVVTFPTDRATKNWTHQPPHWRQLRTRWEASHAVGALLTLGALVLLLLATPPVLAR
jgi:hypothetical protein